MVQSRIQVPQPNAPTISDAAIAYMDDAKKAFDAGDIAQLMIAQRGLELEARRADLAEREFEWKEQQKAIENMDAITKRAFERQLRDKIMAAEEAGDYASANRDRALLEGRQLPSNIQALDEYEGRGFEVTEEVARGFLDPNYQPTSAEEPTNKERDIETIRELEKEGIYTKEQATEAIQGIFLKSARTVPPTDTEIARRSLLAYPKGDPTASALNKMNLAYPNANANKLIAYISNLTKDAEGLPISFEDLKNEHPQRLNEVTDELKTAAELKVGDESVRKVMQAREVLQTEIPNLVELMEDYEKEYGKGSLGRALQIENGVLKRVQGYPSNPDLDLIFTTTQDMIANVLLIRSGATVTDQEREIMNAMVPTAVVPLRFSRARAIGLMQANKRAAQNYYRKSLNQEYANVIVDRYYKGELQSIQELQDNDPEYIKAPKGWSEEQITEMMDATGRTRKEVVDYIKEREKE